MTQELIPEEDDMNNHWLNHASRMAFEDEMKKMAIGGQIDPEERITSDEFYDSDPDDFEEDGAMYHSNDDILYRNNQRKKYELDLRNKKRRFRRRVD